MSIKHLFTLLLLAGAPLFVQADEPIAEEQPQEILILEDVLDEEDKDNAIFSCGCDENHDDEEEEISL